MLSADIRRRFTDFFLAAVVARRNCQPAISARRIVSGFARGVYRSSYAPRHCLDVRNMRRGGGGFFYLAIHLWRAFCGRHTSVINSVTRCIFNGARINFGAALYRHRVTMGHRRLLDYYARDEYWIEFDSRAHLWRTRRRDDFLDQLCVDFRAGDRLFLHQDRLATCRIIFTTKC